MINDLEIRRNAAVSAYLQTHKVAYSYSFRYNDTEHWEGFFDSPESLEDAQVQFLKSIDYKPRKFWQIWRNSETKPPKQLLKRYQAELNIDLLEDAA